MAKRTSKAMWDYLEASGALASGSDEAIKAAKQAYRKQYLLDFKRKQRKSKAEYAVTFSKSNGEHHRIQHGARRHGMTVTAFVRKAALAYLDRTYLVPNGQQIARLEQLLADCLNEIKAVVNKKEKFFWERDNKLEAVERRIEKLEQQIDEALRHPPLLNPDDRQNQIA